MMSRIRTIKPEFWSSPQIVGLTMPARLLFVGLWNFCDDGGRHPVGSRRLRMEVFPGDDFSVEDINLMVTELIDAKLIVAYQVDDEWYWQVTGWHHQKIDRPTYRFPIPPQDVLSTSTRLALDEPSPPEGKGRESKGREGMRNSFSSEGLNLGETKK